MVRERYMRRGLLLLVRKRASGEVNPPARGNTVYLVPGCAVPAIAQSDAAHTCKIFIKDCGILS